MNKQKTNNGLPVCCVTLADVIGRHTKGNLNQPSLLFFAGEGRRGVDRHSLCEKQNAWI
jgi:hypothetical protein